MSRLVILSGPSCIGKGPLHRALKTFYPELEGRLIKVVSYNSRGPRPGERDGVDYHFRHRKAIEEIAKDPGFLSANVRGDLHAIEIASITNSMSGGRDPFLEGNPYLAGKLMDCKKLKGLQKLTIFLSPLSKEEIMVFKDPTSQFDLGVVLTDIMRRKLLRRTRGEKEILSLRDLENIEMRAGSVLTELREAWKYDFVIPNHDGEDSENWHAFPHPVGDARRTLQSFASLLQGEAPPHTERWDEDLIP